MLSKTSLITSCTSLSFFSAPSNFALSLISYSCTGTLLDSEGNSTISNILASDSKCTGDGCIVLNYASEYQVSNVSLNDVQTSKSQSLIYMYFTEASGVFSNTSITNASGFNYSILIGGDVRLDGFFTYENVTAYNKTTPIFNAAADNLTITITTPLPSQFKLSDVYYPDSSANCTIDYLGFTVLSSPPPLPTFSDNSSFPWLWLIIPACVASVAIVAVAGFIIYRKTTASYSTIL